MLHHARTSVLLLIPLLAAACADDVGPAVTVARIDTATVLANPYMVVSALVSFDGRADSVRVRHHVLGSGGDSVTGVLRDPALRDTIPVLGLLPGTTYVLRLVAFGGSTAVPESTVSDSMTFTTGALPGDLPSFAAGGSAPSDGFIVFASGVYGLVIDRTGRVVWYKRFPVGGPGLNFMAQPTGSYVGRLTTADSTDVDPMVELDAAGNQLRAMRCANNRPLRFHDMLLQPDGSYWIMCDEARTLDLSGIGGSASARVTGTVVQHVGAAGNLLFEWNAFDHLLITDADSSAYVGTASVNWTHGNSLDLDTDGNLLVSLRSLDEVTKVNVQTGAVMWRMGGRRNQFSFSGAPDPGYRRQHNLRVVGPGRFILLDNVGQTLGESRYERYAWNAATMTATLEQSYGSTPGVSTLLGGSVQAVASDRYLVSFGTRGRVEEFTTGGTLVWAISGNPGYVFRAQRIRSLYEPVPVLTR